MESCSTSVEIVDMTFKKVERSYYSSPKRWRLATFVEARDGLERIKEQNILKQWDRVRLLDVWITGPGYNFEMGNDFSGCLGYMLLIKIESSSSGHAYANVQISDSQKEVALLLCVDDWNYEVVYWLFNSWRKNDSMALPDVMDGRIPFSYPTNFKEMNTKVCSLARKLGDKGPVNEKAGKRKLLGKDSVRDVLSDMIKIVEEENLPQYFLEFGIDDDVNIIYHLLPGSLKPEWLHDLAQDGGADWDDIADAIWNFLSQSFAESMVRLFSTSILAHICKRNDEDVLETMTSRGESFMFASSVLFNLSLFREHIIHTPLAHGCEDTCADKMIEHVASICRRDDLARFKQTLQSNAMWRCNNQIGNYDLLNKLLITVAGGHPHSRLEKRAENVILLVKSLLDCGAQLGSMYLIDRSLTVLEHAVNCVEDDDTTKRVVEFLLKECNAGQQLINTPNKYDSERTPLHVASQRGYANTCHLLLEHGANADVQDKQNRTALYIASENGHTDTCRFLLEHGTNADVQDDRKRTPLHIAVRRGNDALVNVSMKQEKIGDVLELKDDLGKSPLDMAVEEDDDIKLIAKLISKFRSPEDYFDIVDLQQLLRYSFLEGSDHIVDILLEKGTKLPAGECDDEGKSVLHLAAMCEDADKAITMFNIAFEHIGKNESLVLKCDKRGRTALHEAALNGNEQLCRRLMSINPKVAYLKDRDGRNPLYDAASAKHDERYIIQMLLNVYSVKDIFLNDFTDRNGLTPLHIAASQGKGSLVRFLLYLAQRGVEYLKLSDFLGQTALHKAANCGDYDTLETLLNEGAHPLEERDCDGRTALHYAVKAKTEGDKSKLIDLLLQKCKTDEEKWLFLWASAAGIGTADESLSNDDPLHQFLVNKRNEIKGNLKTKNLLKTAISAGDIEMTKELIARGYPIADISDPEWRGKLTEEKEKNVKKVLRQLERIAEQANDQPTVLDNLGRIDYAQGLAALLLNPYIKPPIVVGITGTWGMGKSSLMVQTESIMLKTAAQMALLPYAKLSGLASELPEITTFELSKKGKKKYEEIKRYVDFEQNSNAVLFCTIMDKILRWLKKSTKTKSEVNTKINFAAPSL